MTTFYKKDHPSVPAPYATTTLINPPIGHPSGSIHEGKSSGSDGSRRSDRMYDMETRLIDDSAKERLIEASNMVSPSSDSGSYTTDEYGLPIRRKRLKGGMKGNPKVNWVDLIPPPPEHPPSAGASPTGTPSTIRNNFPLRNIPAQMPLDNVLHVAYSPSLINRNMQMPNSNRQANSCSPWSSLTRPPQPGDAKRAPTPPALAAMKYPNVNTQRSLPQTFGSNPLMDRAVQSSLVSLASDPHPGHRSLHMNQDKCPPVHANSSPYYQFPPQSQYQSDGRYGLIVPKWCGDNNSAESSAAEDIEYAQGHAPASSWTSATDRSNTSSVRSSVASSSDGSVYTDSDFVNAVTRAAHSAGIHLLSPNHPSRLDNPSMSLLSPVNRC